MTNYLRSFDSEDWSILTVAAGATFLFVALTLEYVFNQLPCALCLNQRMWMILATLLAAGGLAHNPRLGIYPFLTLLASIAGAGFALRQIYIQLSGESCGASFQDVLVSNPGFFRIFEVMVVGTADCGEPSLIPAAALIAFVLLAGGAIMQWRN